MTELKPMEVIMRIDFVASDGEQICAHAEKVQELIRCKDCKHYRFADNRAFGMPVKMCKWFEFEDVDDDDFCSRAERRSDG